MMMTRVPCHTLGHLRRLSTAAALQLPPETSSANCHSRGAVEPEQDPVGPPPDKPGPEPAAAPLAEVQVSFKHRRKFCSSRTAEEKQPEAAERLISFTQKKRKLKRVKKIKLRRF
ncbi:uncharacterized protein V6R79_015627 [Siganus canaliculatus]